MRTSYGYVAPPQARVRGWECRRAGCGTGDDTPPESWPYPCRSCGRPADPVFEQPWQHDAEGYRIRYDLTSTDPYRREAAELDRYLWAYRDARSRGDGGAARTAWQSFRDAVRATPGGGWYAAAATHRLVADAAGYDDIDCATMLLTDWYPLVPAGRLEGVTVAEARGFVAACTRVLCRESSVGHPRADAVDRAMREVAARSGDVMTGGLQRAFWEIGEVRARAAARATMARARRSTLDGLPRLGLPVDAALAAAEIHDDLGPLDEAIRAYEDGAASGVAHLLRARRRAAVGDLAGALAELRLAVRATDRLSRALLPQIHATYARILAVHRPEDLDAAIAASRAGRRAGLHWRRAADTTLARLLVWRALRSGTPRRAADVRQAVRLARRRCRPWNRPTVDDRIVLLDALAARDEVLGGGSVEQRRRGWLRVTGGRWTAPEHARLALAWAHWAVGTGDAHLAAEAYRHVVSLVPADTAARHGASAKQRVLAAAQEHTVEAGYWLARTGRYREAAVALETGRAVGLSEALGETGAAEAVTYADITAATGDGAVAYVAAADAGGYALIAAAGHDPQFMELARLDRATVTGLASGLLPGGYATRGGQARDLAAEHRRADLLADGLKTLWDNGMRDLLLHSARGRIVTLVPVGVLSLLPIHAAGEPGTPGDRFTEWRHAGHFSAIRYAPNARSLRRSRLTAADLAGAEPRLLAVDVADGAGLHPSRHLLHVGHETAAMRRLTWPVTVASDCTWAQFRDAADEHTVWHLACHGSARPHAILDSRLYFADQPVTLAQLRRALRSKRRRLAVLSACESNVTGSALPDEVIGLPSALLHVGFAGVIASAWKVDDLATAYLMTAFYQQWSHGHEPAVALNRAQQWLRTANREDLLAMMPEVEPPPDGPRPYVGPRYWAAFAYTGA